MINKKINKQETKKYISNRFPSCSGIDCGDSTNEIKKLSQKEFKNEMILKNNSRSSVSSLFRQYIKDEFIRQAKHNDQKNIKSKINQVKQCSLIFNNLLNPQIVSQNSRTSTSNIINYAKENRGNSNNIEEDCSIFMKRSPSENLEIVQGMNIMQNNIANQIKNENLENNLKNKEEDKGNNINVKMIEIIAREREKIIKYNKSYYEKNQEFPPTTLEYYKFIKLLGKGAFGAVTLAIDKLTGKYVAIKSIGKESLKDEFSRKKVMREITILKKIKHSNIIRLLEVFQSEKHVLIVTEYADKGDLYQYIKSKKKIPENEAKLIFKQIVYGLAHLHSRNILHRDIKPNNILLDSEGGVKICDFGVSGVVDKNKYIYDQCGTPVYIAPEIISNEGYCGFYVDYWSLGILLYTMLMGKVPFNASNMKNLIALIKEGKYSFPSTITDEAKNLINGLIQLDPQKRLLIPEILQHKWFQTDQDAKLIPEDEYDYFIAKNEETIDDSIPPPSIDSLNFENLFFGKKKNLRISLQDYTYIANDFYTNHLDEEVLRAIEQFGYPKKAILNSLKNQYMNHGVASYNLLLL